MPDAADLDALDRRLIVATQAGRFAPWRVAQASASSIGSGDISAAIGMSSKVEGGRACAVSASRRARNAADRARIGIR